MASFSQSVNNLSESLCCFLLSYPEKQFSQQEMKGHILALKKHWSNTVVEQLYKQ